MVKEGRDSAEERRSILGWTRTSARLSAVPIVTVAFYGPSNDKLAQSRSERVFSLRITSLMSSALVLRGAWM